jgi:hypothetical protein
LRQDNLQREGKVDTGTEQSYESVARSTNSASPDNLAAKARVKEAISSVSPPEVTLAGAGLLIETQPLRHSGTTASRTSTSLSSRTASYASSRTATSYVPLKVWEGYVTELDEAAGIFQAELVERNAQAPPISVEMDIQEISQDDRDLVVPGAVFYWTVGRMRDPNGRVTNYDDIRFRRLPDWTQTRIEQLREESDELLSFLKRGAV